MIMVAKFGIEPTIPIGTKLRMILSECGRARILSAQNQRSATVTVSPGRSGYCSGIE
jgi:hypothetical protein